MKQTSYFIFIATPLNSSLTELITSQVEFPTAFEMWGNRTFLLPTQSLNFGKSWRSVRKILKNVNYDSTKTQFMNCQTTILTVGLSYASDSLSLFLSLPLSYFLVVPPHACFSRLRNKFYSTKLNCTCWKLDTTEHYIKNMKWIL